MDLDLDLEGDVVLGSRMARGWVLVGEEEEVEEDMVAVQCLALDDGVCKYLWGKQCSLEERERQEET